MRTDTPHTKEMTGCPYADSELNEEPMSNDNLSGLRETSTIPKHTNTREYWMYPSEKMFFNSLKQKGMPTNPQDVEMLVSIHNFLNEGVWNEIKRWESLLDTKQDCLSLRKFIGRPAEPTIKARLLSLLRISPRPFDRHDWYVDRCGRDVKYVIDYYHCPAEPNGNAVFKVDVRPTLNSFTALKQRLLSWYCSRTE